MDERLKIIKEKFLDIEAKLADPEVIGDLDRLFELSK